jgi:hypothetical protein
MQQWKRVNKAMARAAYERGEKVVFHLGDPVGASARVVCAGAPPTPFDDVCASYSGVFGAPKFAIASE